MKILQVMGNFKPCSCDCEDIVLHSYIDFMEDKILTLKLKCINCGIVYLEKGEVCSIEEMRENEI